MNVLVIGLACRTAFVRRMLNVGPETLTLHEHHGEEFINVLEGELELTTYVGAR